LLNRHWCQRRKTEGAGVKPESKKNGGEGRSNLQTGRNPCNSVAGVKA